MNRFRPLSGSYISQSTYHDGRTPDLRFPSPIGELHFSIMLDVPEKTKKDSFRPLSGSYISQ